MAALGEPPQGCGGTAGPQDPDRSLFWTIRTPRQAWLGKNLEKPGKTCICWIDRYFWTIFMVNLWERYAQELRWIIVLHFGLVTFRFAYGKDRKPLISMISGFSDVSLAPKTNYLCLETPGYLKYSKKKLNQFWKILFFES